MAVNWTRYVGDHGFSLLFGWRSHFWRAWRPWRVVRVCRWSKASGGWVLEVWFPPLHLGVWVFPSPRWLRGLSAVQVKWLVHEAVQELAVRGPNLRV